MMGGLFPFAAPLFVDKKAFFIHCLRHRFSFPSLEFLYFSAWICGTFFCAVFILKNVLRNIFGFLKEIYVLVYMEIPDDIWMMCQTGRWFWLQCWNWRNIVWQLISSLSHEPYLHFMFNLYWKYFLCEIYLIFYGNVSDIFIEIHWVFIKKYIWYLTCKNIFEQMHT